MGTRTTGVVLVLAIGVSGACGFGKIAAFGQTPTPPQRYEAEIISTSNSQTFHTVLLTDRKSFRLSCWFGDRQPPLKAGFFELYDTGDPSGVVWGYNSDLRRAGPSYGSLGNALEREKAQLGEQAVRHKYRIPARAPAFIGYTPPQPSTHLITEDELPAKYPNFRFQKSGHEVIAGFECQKRDATHIEANGTSRSVSVWVEPKSRLVLRWEERIVGGSASGAPPMRVMYRVVRISFPKRVDRRLFALPPGTTVGLPDTMWTVVLPAGIRREHMHGKGHESGTDWGSSYGDLVR
jgi:hypothetical protein